MGKLIDYNSLKRHTVFYGVTIAGAVGLAEKSATRPDLGCQTDNPE
jgi:hypothetical protein